MSPAHRSAVEDARRILSLWVLSVLPALGGAVAS
jgi:hypothetical protein